MRPDSLVEHTRGVGESASERQVTVEERVADFAKQGLEEGYGLESSFGATDYIVGKLYEAHGKKLEDGNSITKEQQQIVASFLKSLLNESQHRSLLDDPDLSADALRYYQEVLSVSPNIVNRCSPSDMLRLAATANRIPEISGSIGKNFGGEFVYTFNFNSIDSVFETAFDSSDTAEQLDLVFYMSDLAKDAVYQGWADEGYYRILAILERLSQEANLHPVVRYGATISLEQSQLLMQAQDEGVIVPAMSEESTEEVRIEDAQLRRQLITDPGIHGSLVHVAKDAVGRLDSRGLLVSLNRRDLETLKDLPNREVVDLVQSFIRMVEHVKTGHGAVIDVVMALQQMEEKDGGFGTIRQELQNSIPEMNEGSWNELLQLLEQYHGIEQDRQRWEASRFQRAEMEAEHISNEMVEKVKEVFSSHKRFFPDPIREKLESALHRTSFEERYRGVEQSMHMLSYLREVSPELRFVLTEPMEAWQQHHDGHVDVWAQAKKEVLARKDEISDQLRGLLKEITEKEAPVEKKREELLGYAQTQLEILKKEKSHGAPAFSDERVFHALKPISHAREVDVSLLFSGMHHPDIRAQFANDFGVDIRDMTLREQVWFLDYLGKTDQVQAGRLKKSTTRFGIDVARSFMSAEFGDEFQEYVLAIGEHLDKETAQKIFHAFGEIATLAQTEAGKLLETFFVEGKGQVVDPAKIEMELLKRAKRLIEDFARTAITAKATNQKPDSAKLLKQLEQAQADTVLFTSIFKSAFKGEKSVEFEAIRGVEFETVHPEALTQEDRTRMLKIADENWEEVPTMKSFIHSVTKQKLEQPSEKTRWQVLRKNGDVVAFCRFGVSWGSDR